MTTTTGAVRLAVDVMADRDRLQRDNHTMQLAIIAEEGVHRFMGTPVQITVNWPEGPPRGFPDAAAVRAWARERLAEIQAQEKEPT